jgi:hypothetical protein
VERSVEWGGQVYTYETTIMRERPKQHPWLEEQIRALEAIAEAARAGRLRLNLGGELRFEAVNRPFAHLAWGAESYFHGIPLGTVAPPFQYARLVVSYTDRPRVPAVLVMHSDGGNTFLKMQVTLISGH